MNGYVQVVSPCLICGRVFGYNPHRVPSHMTRLGDPTSREPICQTCIEHVNRRRRDLGLETFEIYPDAYEAIPEREL